MAEKDKDSDLLSKEELNKLEGLDWSDITNEIVRNKEMVRSDHLQAAANDPARSGETADLSFLHDVPLKLYVEIGSRKVPVSEILSYKVGEVVELNKMVGQPMNIHVNDVLIGLGTIIEKEQKYGVKITELLDEKKRMEVFSAQAFNKA